MSDLVFEIGTEELPAGAILPACEALRSKFVEAASALRLDHGDVATHGSPRRLALLVKNLAERARDIEERLEGPAVSVAFKDGVPTKAAEGFARKAGVSVDALERATTPQGERLVAHRRVEGQPTRALLSELLASLIAQIPFRKSMRWGDQSVTFVRPVRWIGAVYAGEPVPVSFGDVQAGAVTYGHRFLAPQAIPLTTCDAYVPALRDARVLVVWEERRDRVVAEIDRVAAEAGGRRVDDPELVETITGLVEWPSGVLGSFAADALDMPREVLVSEMRGHQKYASLESLDGKLLPQFVAVANTPVKDVAVSRRGYERVLAARLSDARFFFDEDRTRPLAARINDLRRVTFQERLGSLHDKVERLLGLSRLVSASVAGVDQARVDRVATLCKADLVTGMVGEFPELQGVMGREYARHDGEGDDVALGIFEHYLPRGASDALPQGDLGAIVGITDRLDTIAGIFAIGRAPTGANDPFGLRRACLGIIRVLLDKGWRVSLSALVDEALSQHYASFERRGVGAQPPADDKKRKGKELLDQAEARTQVLEFFRGRLKSDWGHAFPADLVEAVLSAGYDDVVDAHHRAEALNRITRLPDYLPLAIAFGRASNIIEKQARDLPDGAPDPEAFVEAPEAALFEASRVARTKVDDALRTGDYPTALQALAELRPVVDSFFDSVLVMANEDAVRINRLRLVRSVQQLFAPIADFSRLQTR